MPATNNTPSNPISVTPTPVSNQAVAAQNKPTTTPVTTIKKTKLKSNLLDLVQQEVANTSQMEIKIIELNQEVVSKIYADFIVHLETDLMKSTAVQQLRLARAALSEDKEIIVWCASEINKVMVGTLKDVFLDYVKNYTKQPDIRVQFEVDPAVAVAEPVQEKKRSKFDIYEEMARKNPVLMDLKKSLNLVIE